MPTTSKTVDAAAELIRERTRERAAESTQLERALASLPRGRPRPRGAGGPPGSRGSSTTKRRRRRRNTRADQAVKLVADNPGISASEVAKRMKIKPNYLYRVLGDLEKQGKVRKDGRTYHAV
jgi:DNA invertase Pin-like site-specific DNA recombinase